MFSHFFETDMQQDVFLNALVEVANERGIDHDDIPDEIAGGYIINVYEYEHGTDEVKDAFAEAFERYAEEYERSEDGDAEFVVSEFTDWHTVTEGIDYDTLSKWRTDDMRQHLIATFENEGAHPESIKRWVNENADLWFHEMREYVDWWLQDQHDQRVHYALQDFTARMTDRGPEGDGRAIIDDVRDPQDLQAYWNGQRQRHGLGETWADVQGHATAWTINRIAEVNQVVTSKEAEEMLGLSSGSVAQGCRRGKYPTARQSGSTWLIHIKDIWQNHRQRSGLDLTKYQDNDEPVKVPTTSTLDRIRNTRLKTDEELDALED